MRRLDFLPRWRYRSRQMKRSTALSFVCLFALVFITMPIAETRTLQLKIAGDILTIDTNGAPNTIKADGSFFKRASDEPDKAKLVMDFELDAVNVSTNITTNITTMA